MAQSKKLWHIQVEVVHCECRYKHAGRSGLSEASAERRPITQSYVYFQYSVVIGAGAAGIMMAAKIPRYFQHGEVEIQVYEKNHEGR